MKYNTTYKSRVSLVDTIKATNQVIDEINKLYKKQFDLLELTPPLFLEEYSDELINMDWVTRPITFDTTDEYKVGQMMISHTNWLRSMETKLGVKANQALKIKTATIWRDVVISPVSSVTRNEISILFRNDNKEPEDVLREETDKLYKLIKKVETQLAKVLNIDEIFPNIVPYVTSQMLENEYPNIDSKAREEHMTVEENAMVLQNAGDKLFSGHRHTYVPAELYSLKNFNQIILWDAINSSVLKVASIAKVATGLELSDQLSLNNKGGLKENEFYANEIKKDYNIYEIKINVGRLMMGLLKKSHMSEVQPANISSESDSIASRYKVEKY